MKKFILFALLPGFLLAGCRSENNNNNEKSGSDAKDTLSEVRTVPPKELKTKTGKTIIIREAHPDGASISRLQVVTQGFREDQTVEAGETDPVQRVELADLDNDGFEEVYIFTQSAGSGSGGECIAYASDKDVKLKKIDNPVVSDNDYKKGGIFEGYMGHDQFTFEEGMLVRSFPVYKENDSNDKPSGGNRKIFYKLAGGKLELVGGAK